MNDRKDEDMTDHELYMKEALSEASKAADLKEVPVGCVIVHDGEIIARGHNLRQTNQCSTAHAEIIAIEQACAKIGSWRLEDCDLYVTLEPCPMCAGAIVQSRIRKVYYGARDPKGGSVDSCIQIFKVEQFNHHPQWEGGLLEEEASSLLKSFFKKRRLQNKKLKQEMSEEKKSDQKI